MRARRVTALLALLVGLSGCAGEPQARPPLPRPVPTAVTAPTSSPSPTASSAASASASPSVRPTAGPTPTSSPTPTRTPTRTAEPARGPMVVVDPGHSGRSIRSTDRATGLRDVDYPNYPEIYETFDVSTCLAQGLRADGYRVRLTKRRALDSVGLVERARIANEAGAALAVSVHDDHSQGPDFQATYSQRGLKRGGAYHPMYRGTGRTRTVFDDPAVARASERAAATIARERTRAQGRSVSVRENSFTGRPPLEPGNLALVQLLATVPWVYNEAGARSGGSTTRAMSVATEEAYARGLLLGVEAAVPLASGRVDQPSRGAKLLRGCLVTAATPGEGRATRPARYRPAGS